MTNFHLTLTAFSNPGCVNSDLNTAMISYLVTATKEPISVLNYSKWLESHSIFRVPQGLNPYFSIFL